MEKQIKKVGVNKEKRSNDKSKITFLINHK